MKWNIITDSSCDMFGFDKEHENIVFSSVPFTISVSFVIYSYEKKKLLSIL